MKLDINGDPITLTLSQRTRKGGAGLSKYVCPADMPDALVKEVLAGKTCGAKLRGKKAYCRCKSLKENTLNKHIPYRCKQHGGKAGRKKGVKNNHSITHGGNTKEAQATTILVKEALKVADSRQEEMHYLYASTLPPGEEGQKRLEALRASASRGVQDEIIACKARIHMLTTAQAKQEEELLKNPAIPPEQREDMELHEYKVNGHIEKPDIEHGISVSSQDSTYHFKKVDYSGELLKWNTLHAKLKQVQLQEDVILGTKASTPEDSAERIRNFLAQANTTIAAGN